MAAPGKRRRPGPRRALTEDEILDATLQLLDEGGANGASVRGIAAKVGVAPNAVYTDFPDKAAVIRALVDRLFGEVDHGDFTDRAQPWRQRVESLAVELRARLAAHPGAVTLMIGQPRIGPHALTLGERLLELFADAGLTPTGRRARISPAVRLRVQLGRPGYRRPGPGRLASHGRTDSGPPPGVRRRPGRPVSTGRSSGSRHGQQHLHRAVPLGTPPASRRHHHGLGGRPGNRRFTRLRHANRHPP